MCVTLGNVDLGLPVSCTEDRSGCIVCTPCSHAIRVGIDAFISRDRLDVCEWAKLICYLSTTVFATPAYRIIGRALSPIRRHRYIIALHRVVDGAYRETYSV